MMNCSILCLLFVLAMKIVDEAILFICRRKKCWKYSLPCIKMISVAAAEYPRFMDSDTNQNYFGAFNKKTFPISNQSAVNVKIIGTKATQTLRLSIVVWEGKSGCGVDGKNSSSDCLTTRRRNGTEWKRGWIFFFAPLAANDNSSKTWRLERHIADFSLSPPETLFQALGWFHEKTYSWTRVALHFNEFLTFRLLAASAFLKLAKKVRVVKAAFASTAEVVSDLRFLSRQHREGGNSGIRLLQYVKSIFIMRYSEFI